MEESLISVGGTAFDSSMAKLSLGDDDDAMGEKGMRKD